ncbi:MAG: tetraacyldisaccharide 4'-kinase [Bacteroidia bacterium]|nr:tetraacyldisaccharide 4'-kinase [Bacteroidia bacterium]
MIQNWLVKILLMPISLVYGAGISLRNLFYSKGLLKSVEFNLPIISVGNLSVGGAGKSPHIEYLVSLLSDYINVATLSRGYKRRTRGYLKVENHHSAREVGDEPLQFRRKFHEDIVVAVDENRIFGIPKILVDKPSTQVILLDDAFQHRAVHPGLNILLTEYDRRFTKDILLPSGRLREWRSAYKRADIIVITKCAPQIEEDGREKIRQEINPFPHQKLFFSYYDYGTPYNIFNPAEKHHLSLNENVLLVSAIASTDYLLNYLEEHCNFIKTLEFEDHHYFDNHDISMLLRIFKNLEGSKVILTTEKDAVRLELHKAFFIEQDITVFAIPVAVKFHFDQGDTFNKEIIDYLLSFRA